MFFRRKQTPEATLAERLALLKTQGCTVTPLADGAFRISRGECAVDWNGAGRPGLLTASGVAQLVDGGFQKFFQTPGGARKPAIAAQLAALHEFEEDLKEALGEESLYNQALGSVSTYYSYDRLKDRDQVPVRRAWE